MFERFNAEARQVVVTALKEARALGHAYIGTEHILLGLVHDAQSAPARVLASSGLPRERIRAEVLRIVGVGDHDGEGMIPVTPRAKKALQKSEHEATAAGQQVVAPEHIFLAILRDDGMAARILRDSDADTSQMRADVIRGLCGAD